MKTSETSYYTAYRAAREAQGRMDWTEAARLWRAIGEEEQAQTCERIQRVNKASDSWRRRVRQLQAGGMDFQKAAKQADAESARRESLIKTDAARSSEHP